ncbi:hypothetical protein HAX54_044709, partial [Datura stramonium]|nr:hypothetical protein [Datura stramonium]
VVGEDLHLGLDPLAQLVSINSETKYDEGKRPIDPLKDEVEAIVSLQLQANKGRITEDKQLTPINKGFDEHAREVLNNILMMVEDMICLSDDDRHSLVEHATINL